LHPLRFKISGGVEGAALRALRALRFKIRAAVLGDPLCTFASVVKKFARNSDNDFEER
jgi:hypothetical protein